MIPFLLNYLDFDKETKSFDLTFNRTDKYIKQYNDKDLDKNQGVWIGKRPLKLLAGIISVFGAEHWAVMIDGVCFSLTTDNGGADGTIIIEQTNDKQYNYYYYGPCVRDLYDIQIFIDDLNSQNIKYTIYNDNCQKYSLVIAKYASAGYENNNNNFNQALQGVASAVTSLPIVSTVFDIGTIGNSSNQSKPETAGQNSNTNVITIGQMKPIDTSRPKTRFTGLKSMDEYYDRLNQRDLRSQYDSSNYGPTSYQNARFDNKQPFYQNGFGRQQDFNQLQPTQRRSFFTTKSFNQNGQGSQSFSGINYNLPQQVLQSQQPFQQMNNRLQNYETQTNNLITRPPLISKRVNNGQNYPQLQPPPAQYMGNNQIEYEQNDYASGQIEEDED